MSEYKELIDKMRWSYSRLTSFEHCRYGFYLAYIVKDEELYPNESNYYAEVGTFVHKILEKVFKKEMSIDDAPRYFIDHFDECVCETTKESTMQSTYYSCLEYLSEEDFSWIDGYEILGVELKCEFEIDNYPFVGFIDLLLRDKADGEYVIVDHKSAAYPLKKNGGVKKNQEKSFLTYKRQMYLYAYAVYLKYGKFPKELWWNHFKVNERVKIKFSMEDYEEAIRWFRYQIYLIQREEEYEPNKDYFYCNNLCSFRNSCEYNEEGGD